MPCHLIPIEIKKEENADHFGPLLWAVLVFQKDFAVCRKWWKQDEKSRLSAGAKFWKYCLLLSKSQIKHIFSTNTILMSDPEIPSKAVISRIFYHVGML